MIYMYWLVWWWLQGHTRYFFWRNKPLRFLLPNHIREQIAYRMAKAEYCYFNGSCPACGCKTPELFMADKGCQLGVYIQPEELGKTKPCYGAMLNKEKWELFKYNTPSLNRQ